MDAIYLDNSATTVMVPEVATTIDEANRSSFVNPASQHQSGQRSRRTLEAAREAMTRLMGGVTTGMQPDRLILTSGGTESNNLILRGLVDGVANSNIVISAIEHPTISETAKQLESRGVEVRRLAVDASGVVAVDQLDKLIDEQTQLVSVMLGNHETGACQPTHEVARIAHARNVPVHSDAVQAVGKIPVNFRELDVDALSLAAHKFHGPVGIGGLLIRHEVALNPMLTGGFQQQGLRAGTESVALTLGFQKALELAMEQLATSEAQLTALRAALEQKLAAEIPSMIVNASSSPRLPHISNISFPGLDRQAIVLALDMAGIACATGSACASGSSEPSPVLQAMGLEKSTIEGAIRISLSRLTTAAEVDIAAERILRVYKTLQRS